MNQTLFTTYTGEDLERYRQWAERLGCGLEIHTFSKPSILSQNGSLGASVQFHERALEGFNGPLGFHGAFYDMVSASVDPEVVALTRRRYRQNLEIASRLGGEYVVFHANYMGGLKLANYRTGWHERQVEFWHSFMRKEAADFDLYVLLENMWADEPQIISDIVDAVNHPRLQICFDMAHAQLFSLHPLEVWIDVFGSHLYCCHLNNTDGYLDQHWSLEKGVIDYPPLLERLRTVEPPPLLTLEMPDLETIASSLPLLGLKAPA